MKKLIYKGPIRCPKCGSTNTGQGIYVDWCNDCGWEESYNKLNLFNIL